MFLLKGLGTAPRFSRNIIHTPCYECIGIIISRSVPPTYKYAFKPLTSASTHYILNRITATQWWNNISLKWISRVVYNNYGASLESSFLPPPSVRDHCAVKKCIAPIYIVLRGDNLKRALKVIFFNSRHVGGFSFRIISGMSLYTMN